MSNNVNTIDIFHNTLSDYTLDPNDTISITTPVTVGAGGTSYSMGSGSASVYSIGANGSSAYDYSNLTVSSGWSTISSPTTINQGGTMELRGENADIKVNGRSLMDAIDALEQRLNILVPNPELEKEWDELRELGERYRELEKQCKEKGEMWKKLKQMPPPEIK
jgi:hypothetical protein